MFRNLFQNLPPVTKNLLIINVLVWLAINLIPHIGMFVERWGALYYVESPAFKAWQPVTYMFIQQSFSHLFFNMFALLMFGGVIEWTLGSKRFLTYYLSCGIGAAVIQTGVFALAMMKYHALLGGEFYRCIDQGWEMLQQNPPMGWIDPTWMKACMMANTPTIGASGAVYGILLAFGMLYPNREMYIMFIPVAIKAKWMVIGYGALELLLGVTGTADGVAHFAHLGGMIFGFLLLLYWRRRGDFRGWY